MPTVAQFDAAEREYTTDALVGTGGETQMALVKVDAVAGSIAAVSEDHSIWRIGTNRALDLQRAASRYFWRTKGRQIEP